VSVEPVAPLLEAIFPIGLAVFTPDNTTPKQVISDVPEFVIVTVFAAFVIGEVVV